MSATYRLQHPRGKTVVDVVADRRDVLLGRGWTPVEEPKSEPSRKPRQARKPKE